MALEKNGKSDPKEQPPARPVNPLISSTVARAHLECTAGPEKGKTFRIAPNVTVIGRDASCDIVLSETVISRQHCRIDRRQDQWVLSNLSANGTILNKKPATAGILADGDEIRIGVKTRLKFVIESVSLSAGGRPQFRRRTGAPEPEGAEADAAREAAQAAEEEQPSLFQRRRNLFIGLGIYLAIVLVGGAIAAYWKYGPGGPAGRYEVPILTLVDMVRPAPGERPLPIVIEKPEGTYVLGPYNDQILVPAEDFRSAKAVRITGMLKSIQVKFLEQKNAPPGYPFIIDVPSPIRAKEFERQAIEQYRIRDLPGKDRALYNSVRYFQMALAYYGGRGYFEESSVNKVFKDAVDELVAKVDREYRNAVVLEKAGLYQQAWAKYQYVLAILPERENPIFDNVNRRMGDLKQRHPDLK